MTRLPAYILLILAAVAIGFAINRDIQLESQHPGDLRNRVVGARLQMDGHSPYFYGWDSTQPMRYYDPAGYDFMAASNVTASPFFHQLLYPIAGIQQRQFSQLWLIIQYLAWASMLAWVIYRSPSGKYRLLALAAAVLFLFTRCWTDTVFKGQNYFVPGWLALAVVLLLYNRPRRTQAFAAGIAAAALVLVRPTMAFFLLPFIFLLPSWSKPVRWSMLAGVLLITILAFSTTSSRFYWAEYRKALGEHVKLHQRLHPDRGHKVPLNHHLNYEGWDLDKADSIGRTLHYKASGENGNAFVVYRILFHSPLPLLWMSVISLVLIAAILLIFYRRVLPAAAWSPVQAGLLGLCLYMITDFFSPVHRFSYNALPWLTGILLVAGGLAGKVPVRAGVLMITSMLLLCIPWHIIPMQLTVAEFLLFISLLIIASQKKLSLRA